MEFLLETDGGGEDGIDAPRAAARSKEEPIAEDKEDATHQRKVISGRNSTWEIPVVQDWKLPMTEISSVSGGKTASEVRSTGSFSSAVRWVGITKYAAMAMRIGISLVMARLLAPALFGVVEMAYTFFAFARLMRGFSIGEIIVQRDDLDDSLLSTLYWANLAICLIATVILLALSPLAAVVYSDPLVGQIAAALSVCFLLEGLAQISASLLVRDLNFRALGLRDILEVVVMGITSIAMALMGFGAWSIVGGTLISLIARNIALHYARPFRPSMVFDWERLKSCMGFASQMISIRLLGYLKQNLDKIVVGSTLGPSSIGIYGMAKKLVSMPHESVTQIVNRAALSRFAKSQRDLPELASLYMRALESIALISLPMFAALAVLSENLVPVLLGKQWLTAIPLIRILAWAGAISTLSTVRHRLMVARAETRTLLIANLVRFAITSTVIVLSVQYGLETLSWSLLAATVVSWLLENYICFKNWPALSVRNQLGRLWRVLVCGAVSIAAGVGCKLLLDQWLPFDLGVVVGTSAVMGGVYLASVRVMQPPSLKDIAAVAPERFRPFLIPTQ